MTERDIYTPQDLGRDMEAIIANATSPAEIVAEGEKILQRFLVPGNLPEEFTTAPNDVVAEDGYEYNYYVYRIYRTPGDAFNITAAIWPPGSSTGVHDHDGKWVVEGVYDNTLQAVWYDRLDDGAEPGKAKLHERGTAQVAAGTVAHVLPPDEEIHEWLNPTDRPAVSVHIYGADPSTETVNYFNLEDGTVAPVTHSFRYDNE